MTAEWYDDGHIITAAEIIAMQDEVKAVEDRAQEAWLAIGKAKKALEDSQRNFDDARYNSDCARQELAQMLETVKEQSKEIAK